jgi:hypothetical protein
VARPRTLRQILELPQTAAEERFADEHIRAECKKIQASWAPRESALRAGYDRLPSKRPSKRRKARRRA